MNSQQLVNQWLGNLGLLAEGHAFQLVDGIIALASPDHALYVEVAQADAPVGIYVDLGPVDSVADRRWYSMMLEANFLGIGTGGATLAIHPVLDRWTIGICLPVGLLNEVSFTQIIDGLLGQADYWKQTLIEFNESPTVSPAEATAVDHRLFV